MSPGTSNVELSMPVPWWPNRVTAVSSLASKVTLAASRERGVDSSLTNPLSEPQG